MNARKNLIGKYERSDLLLAACRREKTRFSPLVLNRSVLNPSNRIRVYESAFDSALSLMKNSKVGQQPCQSLYLRKTRSSSRNFLINEEFSVSSLC